MVSFLIYYGDDKFLIASIFLSLNFTMSSSFRKPSPNNRPKTIISLEYLTLWLFICSFTSNILLKQLNLNCFWINTVSDFTRMGFWIETGFTNMLSMLVFPTTLDTTQMRSACQIDSSIHPFFKI